MNKGAAWDTGVGFGGGVGGWAAAAAARAVLNHLELIAKSFGSCFAIISKQHIVQIRPGCCSQMFLVMGPGGWGAIGVGQGDARGLLSGLKRSGV